MSGTPKIFVDFSIRDPEGRFYVASLHRFDHRPVLRERFIATDFEDFDDIECEVLAIDHPRGRVYHRPVDPSTVPGTYTPVGAHVERGEIDASSIEQPAFA